VRLGMGDPAHGVAAVPLVGVRVFVGWLAGLGCGWVELGCVIGGVWGGGAWWGGCGGRVDCGWDLFGDALSWFVC